MQNYKCIVLISGTKSFVYLCPIDKLFGGRFVMIEDEVKDMTMYTTKQKNKI